MKVKEMLLKWCEHVEGCTLCERKFGGEQKTPCNYIPGSPPQYVNVKALMIVNAELNGGTNNV